MIPIGVISITCIARNFHYEKFFVNFTSPPTFITETFIPWIFLSWYWWLHRRYDVTTFITLVKVVFFSVYNIISALLTGLDEIFCPVKISGIRYIPNARIHVGCLLQIAGGPVPDPLPASLQASSSLHPGWGGRCSGPLSHTEHRPDAPLSLQTLPVHCCLTERWNVQQCQRAL